MVWHAAFEKINPYLVKINTESGFGTGFLFAFNKDHSLAAIATAAHVIEDDHLWQKPIKIGHYTSKSTTFYTSADRVIWIDSARDAATIVVKADSLPLPSTVLPLIDKDAYKKVGVEVGWVGFPAICPHKLCFFSGKVSTFLENADCYLIDGVAINGVSGGPVFGELHDSTPEIVGIVSAYMPNQRASNSLPGLLKAQDVTSFHEHIKTIENFDDAKEQEQELRKNIDRSNEESSSDPNVACGTP